MTGGASGIGAAVVAQLTKAGVTAVSWDVGGEPDVPCDVADPAAVAVALNATVERAGVPSILVAAAGVPSRATVLEETPEGWDRTFAVNARGVFLCVRALAAELVRTGGDGSFVAVSSVNGGIADPGVAAYSASKAAVDHLVRVTATELGPHGIRVNSIAPGPTETPMLAPALDTPGYLDDVNRATPLGRIGTPDLVADTVLHVLAADWMTGVVVRADGGSALMTARGLSRFTATRRI
ncbi:SDR family oxidoreductase [Pseudonocardia sp. NPDC049154]|uniref:SDR family NAD(P)-dependent oxidoreductase n=1 Tax=Pseudonocardia sp. NPDC049154 TaxID=3155501 RepID=UPI0033DA38D3